MVSYRARRRTVIGFVSGLVALLATAAAAGPAAPADLPGAASSWLFDFGCATSPVADGYLQVTNSTLYDAGRGFGLDRATNCRDRGQPDDLRGDFTVAGSYSFAVDVPDGDYRVVIVSGDQIAANNTDVSVENAPTQTISSVAGSFPELGLSVSVSDGQMSFVFGRDGRVNAIGIAQISAPAGVRVGSERLRPTPSVALAWDASPEARSYNIYRKRNDESNFHKIASSAGAAYTDSTVELGLTYEYAISAQGAGIIESAQSAPLPVNVFDESVPPPPVPADLRLETSIVHDTFTLRWQKVSSARQYYIYRADGAAADFIRIDTAQAAEYTLFIAPSTPCCYDFQYRVVAVSDGGLSGPSDAVRLTSSGS